MLKTALSIIEGRINSEQPDMIDLYPLHQDSLLDRDHVNYLVGLDMFGANVSTRIVRSGALDYLIHLTETGKPKVVVHVSRVRQGVIKLEFTPLARNTPVIKFAVGHAVSKKQLISMYDAAVGRFSKMSDAIVAARAAGEVQVITNMRREMPRSFNIGNLAFRLDGSGIDDSEYRSWLRYVAPLDSEKKWQIRLYFYMDERGTGHSILHDEEWPISYYIQFDIDNKKADVIDDKSKPVSVPGLIKLVTGELMKLKKSAAELIKIEKMADAKIATAFANALKEKLS
jgi:hypothetical protein